MRSIRIHLLTRSAFGTKPLGDTLFGQLCWAIRNRQGEAMLNRLLDGYTRGYPFMVVSDAFPAGFLPRPALPTHMFRVSTPNHHDRKALKKRQWLPFDKLGEPIETWLDHCLSSQELPEGWITAHSQAHNTIDRRTGTTGEGRFAPFSTTQWWYGKAQNNGTTDVFSQVNLDLYVLFDDTRLSLDHLQQALTDIGQYGFGSDASVGLGRFTVEAIEEDWQFPPQSDANAWMTLAPSAPQGFPWDRTRCYYQIFNRFGRHGDMAVLYRNPFKNPVLLTATGAVLTPQRMEARLFVGQGLGGNGSISNVIPETVHQGYAPVIGLRLKVEQEPA